MTKANSHVLTLEDNISDKESSPRNFVKNFTPYEPLKQGGSSSGPSSTDKIQGQVVSMTCGCCAIQKEPAMVEVRKQKQRQAYSLCYGCLEEIHQRTEGDGGLCNFCLSGD